MLWWSIELKWSCAPQDQYKVPCDEDNLNLVMNEYGWINDVEANANLMDSIPNYRKLGIKDSWLPKEWTHWCKGAIKFFQKLVQCALFL